MQNGILPFKETPEQSRECVETVVQLFHVCRNKKDQMCDFTLQVFLRNTPSGIYKDYQILIYLKRNICGMSKNSVDLKSQKEQKNVLCVDVWTILNTAIFPASINLVADLSFRLFF